MKVTVPISVGELLDKISILQIKSQHTDDPYVIKELKCLTEIAEEQGVYDIDFIDRLFDVNCNLWVIEDDLREFEKTKTFDAEFVSKARMVYLQNDKRAAIKREINEHTGSEFFEVKIY